MYTRRGDKGETSLYGPKRVSKDSPRVEAYGTVDELNSYIGVVLSDCRDTMTTNSLEAVQRLLFVAGADLATDFGSSARVPRIREVDTRTIEKMTDDLLKRLPRLVNFILPGGTKTAAELQFARSICRRTERKLVAASKVERLNPALLPFFNRLSTYLFDLARASNLKRGRKEDIWKG